MVLIWDVVSNLKSGRMIFTESSNGFIVNFTWNYCNLIYSVVGMSHFQRLQCFVVLFLFFRIISEKHGFHKITYSSNTLYFPYLIPLYFFEKSTLSSNKFEEPTRILWTVCHCSQTKNPSSREIKQILRE